ncbi:TPA: hypothetical protein HA251_02805 [Candidatus Woesearchaeota archaeon]|nr:hypothetical protein [Candidatus Woesearchaeota archaeon]
MKTLQAIILATTIGATACGPAAAGAQSARQETVTGVPLDRATRSQTAHSTGESYTFPLAVDGKMACARHTGGYKDDGEYDVMIIGIAEKQQRPVTFRAEGSDSNGCYVMRSRPQLVPGQR